MAAENGPRPDQVVFPWAAIFENRARPKANAPPPMNAIRNQCGQALWPKGGTAQLNRCRMATAG